MQSPPTLYSTDFEKIHTYILHVTTTLRRFPRSVGLAFCGVSGMLVGLRAADRTKRPYSIIRKTDDNSHSSREVEGWIPKEYVIIDDFISSGATVEAIIKKMSHQRYKENVNDPGVSPKCVGIILYRTHSSRQSFETHKKIIIPVF